MDEIRRDLEKLQTEADEIIKQLRDELKSDEKLIETYVSTLDRQAKEIEYLQNVKAQLKEDLRAERAKHSIIDSLDETVVALEGDYGSTTIKRGRYLLTVSISEVEGNDQI